MTRRVEITFDCMPLRSLTRRDVPWDASPGFRALCERILAALDKHGGHNSYYLHNAGCVYHLANDEQFGILEFEFEGTVFTNADDSAAERADLEIELKRETCSWLTEPVVKWFKKTIAHAVRVEFDLFIAAGNLAKTEERIRKLQEQSDSQGGFLGMGL